MAHQQHGSHLLIVVDMQNDFITGALGTPEARAVLPHVIQRVQDFKGPVLFTRDSHGADYPATQEGRLLPVTHCQEGTEGWQIQEDLEALAAEIAGQIDGDAHAALKPGDETTPAFTAIRDRLAAFRDANPGVIYVYTMRNVNGTVEYVVDADYGSVDTPGIGEVCNDTGAAMLAGFKEASAESAFVTEQWGNETATTLSGYAPVKDSTGAVVGLVGVDMGRLW